MIKLGMSGLRQTGSGVAAAALLSVLGAGTASSQTPCEAMTGLQFPDVRIEAATSATSPTPHCKIDGVIGKEIRFSLWMPDAWNGKFVMGGQGGFAGRVENQAMTMQALQKGYATAGTDNGHVSQAADGSWALGEMERIVNYAHLAVHRTTEVSKAAVKARYGRPADKSYFAGCSNGGRAALMSAQRYPNDFDAIIAGAPALNFTGIAATFTNITRLNYPDPTDLSKPVLSRGDRDALGKAVLAKCDAADGLADGVMTNPNACNFDPKTIACTADNADGCLTSAEIGVVEAVTRGPVADGKAYHVGFPWGGEPSEAGWGTWLIGSNNAIGPGVPSLAFGFGVGFMRYFVMQDANWDYRTLNLSSLAKDVALMQATLSPTNTDLSAFRSRGGKLLMYHGWSDSALSPNMSLKYVDEVYAKDATARNDVRLFMLPGVLHCAGGPGPDRIDYLDALDKWAGGGAAPDELMAGFASGGARKVCAYPKVQTYAGTGDGKSPEHFSCK